MGLTHNCDVQIRFADVDILGHVNNVNLQHLFDTGKMHFYHDVLGGSIDWHGQSLVLVSVKTDFAAQTRLYDDVYVETRVERIGNKSVTVFQRLIDRPSRRCNATCRSVMVGYDFAVQDSVAVRDDWRALLLPYLIAQ